MLCNSSLWKEVGGDHSASHAQEKLHGMVFVLLELLQALPWWWFTKEGHRESCGQAIVGFQSLAPNNSLVCWGRDGCQGTQGPINPKTHSGSLCFVPSKAKILKV